MKSQLLPFIHPEHWQAAIAYCARVFITLVPTLHSDLTDHKEFMAILAQFEAGLFGADAAHGQLEALFGIKNVELTEGFERFYDISAVQVAARARTSAFKAACAAAMVPYALAPSGFEGMGTAPQGVDFGAGGGLARDARGMAPAAAPPSWLDQGAGVLVTPPPLPRSLQHADDFKHGTAPPPDMAPRASQAPPAPALPPHKKLFTHAICGKTFTAKYYVKRHHFGAGKGKYGCWHVNGEPPIPWDYGLPQ
ncbi:hypothetical protein W97_06887 [Coniosporium apollinis CBS 100218]|uniref:Uncharacterized protein n=1 Tax=Coniosporium apollinis (strain CBS 100218) TaxID=1168221 RepID=R7Z0E6_CONA1|nr:uncharacterized protein W97_06887 [Coniosporium apollinis CBS 100218]EON67519.1 hypothetical protein W97_06887 [Coniosporium apollinis CBS 100218]